MRMIRPARNRGLLQLRDTHAASRDWAALADAETALSSSIARRDPRFASPGYVRGQPALELDAFRRLLLLGFCGMLRPDEFLFVSRRDLVLLSDRLEAFGDAFLRIAEAKTRRLLRHHHARISDSAVVKFFELSFGPLGRDEPLAPYGASSFCSRWNAVLSQLGVPSHLAASGPTPGSLRGSSATAFYHQTEDVPRIAWRGRWRKVESLSSITSRK